jgi:hypothetical protein
MKAAVILSGYPVMATRRLTRLGPIHAIGVPKIQIIDYFELI